MGRWKIVIKCKNCGDINTWSSMDGLCNKCGCKVAKPGIFFRYCATPTKYGVMISARRKYRLFGEWIESGYEFITHECKCNNI